MKKVFLFALKRNESTGALTEIGSSPYHIPSVAGKTKEQVAFIGLTGFDKMILTISSTINDVQK